MGSRKEHHYVPKFYLKNFSSNQEQTQINLFDIKKDSYFEGAGIRHQAKAKFLYGEDDVIESHLGKIEQKSAGIINTIIKMEELADEEELMRLSEFILYQHVRTVEHMKQTQASQQAMYNSIFQESREGNFFSVKEIMDMTYHLIPYLQYTTWVLVKNSTNIPFITCDNPVIRYNTLMERNKSVVKAAWANKGLQILFPISSDYLIYGYDPFMYAIEKNKKFSKVIHARDRDVEQLNALQYLHCDSHLYFDNGIDEAAITSMVEKFKNKRNRFKTIKTMRSASYRIVAFNDPQIGLQLSFSKLTMKARKYTPSGFVAELRHPDLGLIREIQDKMFFENF